ncbi:MAG: hypothetical protein HYW49_09455 [Deltaproteobacteria bacterium]|nr:hypothetical protein [Deltaproteobacteria bacterium]
MIYNVRFIALVATVFVIGCAHSTMRGTVAMKVSDEEAHVCMGDNEVKAGDEVALYKNVCTSPKAGVRSGSGGTGDCKKVSLGQGRVLRALNEHYSVIKVDPGVAFDEGTVVEKQ